MNRITKFEPFEWQIDPEYRPLEVDLNDILGDCSGCGADLD